MIARWWKKTMKSNGCVSVFINSYRIILLFAHHPQRDNLIKEHEARILQLEDNLARRIYGVSQFVSAFSILRTLVMFVQPHTASALKPSAVGTPVDSSPLTVPDMNSEPDFSYPADNHFIPNPIITCNAGPTNPVAKQTKPAPSMPPPPPGHTSFSKLAREDVDGAESEEEKQQTNTKRVLFADNGSDPSTSRPTRRAVSAQFVTMTCKAADSILAFFFPRDIPNLSNPKERLTMLACDTPWSGRLTVADLRFSPEFRLPMRRRKRRRRSGDESTLTLGVSHFPYRTSPKLIVLK